MLFRPLGTRGLSLQHQHHLNLSETQILRTHPRRPKSEACLWSDLEGFWDPPNHLRKEAGMWSQALNSSRALYQSPSTFHSLAVSQHVLLESELHISVLIPFFFAPHTCVSCTSSHLLGPAHSRIQYLLNELLIEKQNKGFSNLHVAGSECGNQ